MNIKLHEGEVVDGRYRVVKPLGRGGFASVYEALHLQLDRPAALKVLDPITMGSPETFRTRFLTEARIAASLDHPNVVRIFDFGFVAENQPYIAMEKLNGMDLDTYLVHTRQLAPDRAKKLFLPILDALRVGHEKGVIHKDLKPSNLFFVDPDTPQERLVILDYGIARIDDDDSPRLTQTGSYTGTPAYMPPEYIQKRIVAPTFDVYQFGLMYIEVLIGRPVIEAETSIAAMVAHVQGEHRVPEALAQTEAGRVLMRAIEVDHDKRYQNAGEFLAALSAVDADPLVLGDGPPTVLSGAPVMTMESQEFGEGDTADSKNALPAVHLGPSTSQNQVAPEGSATPESPALVAPLDSPAPPAKKKSMLPIIVGLVVVAMAASIVVCASGIAIYMYTMPNEASSAQTTHKPSVGSSLIPAFVVPSGNAEVTKITHYYLALSTVSALFIYAENYKRTSSKSRDSVLAPSAVESLGSLATSQIEAGQEADPQISRLDQTASGFDEKLDPFIASLADVEAFYDGIGEQSETKRKKMEGDFKKSYYAMTVVFNKMLKHTSDAALRHAVRCKGDDDAYFVAVCGVVEASLLLASSARSNHRSKTSVANLDLLRKRLGALKTAQKQGTTRLKNRFQSNPTAISGVYEQGKDLLKTTESLADTTSLSASDKHGFVNGAYYVVQRYSVVRQFAK